MKPIKTILFDMDGVFCDYDVAARLAYLEHVTGLPGAEIDAKIFKSDFEDKADWGQFGAAAYVEEIARLLSIDMDAETWLTARAQAMTPYPEMFELARALRARYPVALLSNNGWLLRQNIGRILPELPEVFENQLYFSAEIGGGKESPATFGPLLAMLGWQADNTLFIDDSPVYIAAAHDAGLQTHHFTDIASFRVVADGLQTA